VPKTQKELNKECEGSVYFIANILEAIDGLELSCSLSNMAWRNLN